MFSKTPWTRPRSSLTSFATLSQTTLTTSRYSGSLSRTSRQRAPRLWPEFVTALTAEKANLARGGKSLASRGVSGCQQKQLRHRQSSKASEKKTILKLILRTLFFEALWQGQPFWTARSRRFSRSCGHCDDVRADNQKIFATAKADVEQGISGVQKPPAACGTRGPPEFRRRRRSIVGMLEVVEK